MNRGLYTAATGMSASQRMLDVTANNLANVSTNGYKADGLMFKDALEASMSIKGRGIGQMSFGAAAAGQFTDFAMGTINQTGNALDMAINNERGAFKVQTPTGPRYTRDGAFRLDDQNQIVNREGFPVLDANDNPIVVTGADVRVDVNGEVHADNKLMGRVGVFEGSFKKEGGNLYNSPDAQASEEIGLAPRALEGSNVNAVEAMVQMITVSRTFEMAQKAVTQHDELTQRLIQSLNER